MKAKGFYLLLMAALLLGSCSDKVYKQNGTGVAVKVRNSVENGPALVRLEVMGENIIRVSATPEKKFADPQSLVILPAQVQTPFTVAQNGDTVSVATPSVTANVLASTGEVWFTDAEGRLLLRESGTEPVIRVMVECDDEELCRSCAERVADAVKSV